MSKVKKAKPAASNKAKAAPKKTVAAKKSVAPKSVKAVVKKPVASSAAKKPAAASKAKAVTKKPVAKKPAPMSAKKQEHAEAPKVRNDKPSSELFKASTELQKQPTMTGLCKVICSAWQQFFGKK